ncbi:Hpt domain-containing response regulator [Dyella choica]|uniref:Hpt domain-containing response regulator n=1 Tax=Dyella choica TaxID=1927959 RepID=UPI00131508F1|nr:response regulator [Dyella choica]
MQATPTQTPARVLVIDEDPQSRCFLVDQIKALGQEPLAVPDSLAALNVMTYQAPDLILMACDGPDTAVYKSALRLVVANRARHASIPIIILSTTRDAFLWQLCMDDGIVGVLQKPVHAGKLEALLRVWLDLPLLAHDEPSEPDPPFETIYQWYQASQASLVEETRAFEQALAEHDKLSMAHFAHRAQGVAFSLGAHQAAELADRLEQAARGNLPWESKSIQETLAALKEAIARHFEESQRAGGTRSAGWLL